MLVAKYAHFAYYIFGSTILRLWFSSYKYTKGSAHDGITTFKD